MLIAFTGKAGSGKSTACQMVQDDLPDVIRVNFKDGLVEEMKKNFPNLLREIAINFSPSGDYAVDELFTDKPPLMRALMQEYGTEVRRGDDPDYWAKQWKETVLSNQQFHIVCDDVRFLNEAKAVKELGGIIVRIVRDDITYTGSHQSEIEMDQIQADFTLHATKDGHQELHRQVRELYTNSMLPE